MKRILLTLLLLLPALVGVADNSLWTYYQAYHKAEQVVCAGSRTYAIFNGNLLCYDTDDGSVATLDKLTGLSGKDIQYIGYSRTQQCAVLIYSDNNIDVLRENGTVVNIPQVKNFSDYSITCNNLNVSGDWATISTTEGIVLVDLAKCEIKGYYRIGQSVNDAVLLGSKLYAALSDRVVAGNLSDNLYDFSQWTTFDTHSIQQFVKFNNAAYALAPYNSTQSEGGLFYISPADDASATITRISTTWLDHGSEMSTNVQFVGSRNLLTATADNPTTIVTTPLGFTAQRVARAADGTYWFAQGADGLHNFRINSSAGTVSETNVEIGNFGPITDNCYRLAYVGNRLFVSGGRLSHNYDPTAMILENKTWKFFETDGLSLNNDIQFYSVSSIAQDPNDASHHYVSFFGGLLEYRDLKFVRHWNASNSPLQTILVNGSNYSNPRHVYVDGLNFDANGNLWMLNQRTDSIVKVLMKDGTWRSVFVEGMKNAMTPEKTLLDSKGRMWIASRSTSTITAGLACVDPGNGLTATSDVTTTFRYSAANEDGTSTDFSQVRDICFDRDGQLWIASANGAFVVTDPDEWSSSSFTIYQPKVPRNDGTNYADYLLTGVDVTAVAVDGGNRKWLGTMGSGIYLVSADGSEVLEHFTESDTPLLSDNIYSLAIHPTTGEVMIGTDKGLCSYRSGVTQPESSLSKQNIKVYPNPVRPDYSGHVTITGLTDGAEVKILSSSGQLVHRGNATGGSYLWDVTGPSGNRVTTGVYFIMVATSDGNSSVAAKVAVI